MRIVLCDDHRMFIEALGSVLEARGWNVCALASRPDEGGRAIGQHQPDVGVMDFGFPDGNAMDVIRAVTANTRATRIVLLTGMTDPGVVASAIEAGVTGFASKTQDIDQIITTIERVGRGDVVIDPALLRKAVCRPPADPEDLLTRFLTDRERDVLGRLVDGQSTATIARDMGITTNTARTHIQNVLNKLGVHSRLEAAALAVRATRRVTR